MCDKGLEDVDDFGLYVVVEQMKVGYEFFLERVRLQGGVD